MSIESLPDTWHTRDLPVLRAIVKQYDATTQTVPHQDIEAATGFDYADVQRACIALDRAGYVDTTGSLQTRARRIGNPSAEARRLTGQWPTPESAADRMLAALEQIAENGTTEDERSGARKVLDGFSNAGRQVAISVAGAVITGGLT